MDALPKDPERPSAVEWIIAVCGLDQASGVRSRLLERVVAGPHIQTLSLVRVDQHTAALDRHDDGLNELGQTVGQPVQFEELRALVPKLPVRLESATDERLAVAVPEEREPVLGPVVPHPAFGVGTLTLPLELIAVGLNRVFQRREPFAGCDAAVSIGPLVERDDFLR